MTNKLLTLFVAVLLWPAYSFGIGAYAPGDELFVQAGSGLILRKTADPKGERIETLNLGDAVKVLSADFKKKTYSVTEFKNFTIKGFWVKVKAADGKEGYVFDGYLSKYRAPVAIVDDANTGNSMAELYLLANTQKKGNRIEIPKPATTYEHYRQLFKNGAEAEIQGGEGGAQQKITFQKGITPEEAYLIGKTLWLKDKKVKSSINKGKITVQSEDEADQIEVENRIGVTILTMSHAD